MALIELPGSGESKSKLPLYVALGGLVIGLMVFGRKSGDAGPTTVDDDRILEFQRNARAAENDMRMLTAANDLQRHELDLAQANSPAGLRECYTAAQWAALPKDAKRLIKHQAKRSGSLITGGPGGGICVVPTDRGIEGDLQSTQRTRTGLFSSSSGGIGTSAPPAGRPGLLDALDAYFAYGRGRR